MDAIQQLCTLLGEEAAVCHELAGVLRDERRAVVQLRPEAIIACLEQREALQQKLTGLAQARRELVLSLAAARGAHATRATEVLPLLPLERQPDVRGRLRALRRALLETRGLQRQNALLVGSSLDSVNELLRALRALVPGARYGAGAEVETPALGERLDQRV
jgi:flagellar biosynthesis/type III secretory pathway chaperone